jgi:hypothetical protein
MFEEPLVMASTTESAPTFFTLLARGRMVPTDGTPAAYEDLVTRDALCANTDVATREIVKAMQKTAHFEYFFILIVLTFIVLYYILIDFC